MNASVFRRDSRRRLFVVLGLLVTAFTLPAAVDAFAQTNPFGGARAPAAPPDTGIVGWLLAKQGEFYRQLSALVRAAKTDGRAAWTLFGLSFLYGIFHAAGPGHGKAVISSYLVANEETWRRGIVLSFASALVQAMVAILVVAVAAVALNATARAMNTAVWWIEVASYALIMAMGARLTWVKGKGLLQAWRTSRAAPDEPSAADHDDHAPAAVVHNEPACCAHGHHHHDGHDHGRDHGHGHGDDHADHRHHDDAHCGHSHGPEPADLAGPGGWRRGLTAIVAVGLRPCSGAILVLVFALAQGLFWAGIASAFAMGLGTAITVAAIATLAVAAKGIATRMAAGRNGTGTLIVRGIETGAAVLVLVFGLALMLGYMATERMVGL
jgi:nickel/cobalt transporter (NicO) family protein